MSTMRQIEVDLELHKKIENSRISFTETPNDVLKRLLGLEPALEPVKSTMRPLTPTGRGLFVKGVFIPAGTRLRKILKGVELKAQVADGSILFEGKNYPTPSAAACKAAGNSVNGWIFWDYFDENAGIWRNLSELRSGRRNRALHADFDAIELSEL